MDHSAALSGTLGRSENASFHTHNAMNRAASSTPSATIATITCPGRARRAAWCARSARMVARGSGEGGGRSDKAM